ncbi:MAG: class I poly(R)-hydroxyalkanoic acid synthase [Herminiimonas sp.]|nr:class I poly(R)-hydroxyalkanoic acid synthase [Herminiimonas sp.]
MKPTDISQTVPAWIAQLANPESWQAWMTQAPMAMPAIDPTALTASMTQFGTQAAPAWSEIVNSIDPEVTKQLQQDYVASFSALVQDLAQSKIPALPDKRFKAPAWQSNSLHAFNAAAYLLNARFLMAMADAVKAPPKAKQKIRFAVQQMVDALSPSNFLVTNPDAQQKVIETKGESLQKGITHMLADIKKGRISQTDENAFEVGKNVATTAGTVVFENDIFQLIQYAPLTKTVSERPLLIVPPCINKFYILDLQPDNSLVRYAVEEGNTVFLVSWRNVDESLSHLTWDDYIEQGVMKAIAVTQAIGKQDKINAFGFCVGGTLLSTALAVMAARGQHPVSSLTLLTAFLDFSDTGVIDVYIDEMQVGLREKAIGAGGLMKGSDFTSAFSTLRPNDLIWNYVGTNYLKGEEPPAFDLLYWNADGTNLPGPMFCWYLRNTYLENNLRTPGKVTVLGESIDFGKIDAPTFLYASREDHIVPWQSAFGSQQLLNPKKLTRNQFVLGASGHIAGVVNPPAKKKRSYWVNPKESKNPEAWLAGATEHPGSWWTEWSAFLSTHGGKKIAAPKKPGNTTYTAIEPAPGRYVKVRLE